MRTTKKKLHLLITIAAAGTLLSVKALAQSPVCSTTPEDSKAAALSTKYVDVISPKGQPDQAEVIIEGKLQRLTYQDVEQQFGHATSDLMVPAAKPDACAKAGALVAALSQAGTNLARRQLEEAEATAQQKYSRAILDAQTAYTEQASRFHSAPPPSVKPKDTSSQSGTHGTI